MSGQLEQSQYANDREKIEYISVFEVGSQFLQNHVRIERHGRDEVDPVDHVAQEIQLRRRNLQSHKRIDKAHTRSEMNHLVSCTHGHKKQPLSTAITR